MFLLINLLIKQVLDGLMYLAFLCSICKKNKFRKTCMSGGIDCNWRYSMIMVSNIGELQLFSIRSGFNSNKTEGK